MPPSPTIESEEHELPCIEAVLAGTLALMTGYGQALQADLHPQQRLAMGRRIVANLELIGSLDGVSESFRAILRGLSGRWRVMVDCTAASAPTREAALRCAAPSQLQ